MSLIAFGAVLVFQARLLSHRACTLHVRLREFMHARGILATGEGGMSDSAGFGSVSCPGSFGHGLSTSGLRSGLRVLMCDCAYSRPCVSLCVLVYARAFARA